ncbi:MAG: hypothetical protein HC848_09800 [Limnobacter sp.]|nr:hypothetical protein [Limnobacter sp.]
MRLSSITLAVLAALAASTPVLAQEPTQAADSQSLVNSVKLGIANSPALSSEIHELEALMFEANGTYGEMLPTVDLRGSVGREHI